MTQAPGTPKLRHMPKHSAELDPVFRALADPTRRAVLARLGEGSSSTSELAEPFPMSLPSFTQHMGVLESAGLVRSTKRGRVRTYELSPKPLAQVEHWLASKRALWEKRLDQLDALLLEMKETET